jgi:hypothetical protein
LKVAASIPPSQVKVSGGGSSSGGSPSSSGAVPGSRQGEVNVAAGANLPGKPLQKSIVQYVKDVAGLRGQPITIGTGTNHSKFTVNGNVSDHYSGNAADLPVPSRIRMGARIRCRR